MTHGASKSPKSHKSGGQKSPKSTKPSKSPSFRSKSRTRVRYVDVYHQVSSSYSLLPKPFHCRPIIPNQITGTPVNIAIILDDLVNCAKKKLYLSSPTRHSSTCTHPNHSYCSAFLNRRRQCRSAGRGRPSAEKRRKRWQYDDDWRGETFRIYDQAI